MTRTRRLTLTGTGLLVLATAVFGAGCGETAPADPTPVQTFKITPAANVTAAGTAAPATTPTPETTSGATPVSAGVIALAGISNKFDLTELSSATGSITIEFDNRDGGVVHNIHIFKGEDADGESVAETELEVGPIEQTLTFEAQAGAYFYQCDAHPNTMSGTLTVR